MKINLLELSGLKKKYIKHPKTGKLYMTQCLNGHNKALTELAQIDIELDREELISEMAKTYPMFDRRTVARYADAIISNSNKIIKVVKK